MTPFLRLQKIISLTAILLFTAVSLPAQEESYPISRRPDDYIKRMEIALENIIQKCKRQPQHALIFSANLVYAHEGYIKSTPLDTLNRYIDALKDAGVRRIDINMGLYPWLNHDQETIAKYDSVIGFIRSLGLELAVNPQYSGIYHKASNFKDWEDSALKAYVEIAKRYQPDIFVVVHEPTTMSGRMQFSVSPEQWRSFAKKAIGAVKGASKSTRCGAGFLHNERKYFDAMLKIKELDVVSLDLYTVMGMRAFNQMILAARKKGKPVYIEETWRPTNTAGNIGKYTLDQISAFGVGNETFAGLDAKWLEAVSLYAGAWGLEAVTPFWTTAFFKYVTDDGYALGSNYNQQVIKAINNGERTSTFDAYKKLINQR